MWSEKSDMRLMNKMIHSFTTFKASTRRSHRSRLSLARTKMFRAQAIAPTPLALTSSSKVPSKWPENKAPQARRIEKPGQEMALFKTESSIYDILDTNVYLTKR